MTPDTITAEDLALHAQWKRDSNTGKRLLRPGANLTGADLTGADLTVADLTGAYLAGAYLAGADLTRANLTGAYLSRADLTGADLTGADLTGADLTGANLTRANLAGAIGLTIAADAPARLLAVARAALQPGALEMRTWHTCETTHCISGWAIHQAGELGRVLEAAVGNYIAGLYLLGAEAAAHFYDSNEKAAEYLQSVIDSAENTTTQAGQEVKL